MSESRWYPPKVGMNWEQENAHRLAFDKIYELEDKLTALQGKHDDLHAKMQGVTKENEKLKEIINNRIAGRLVTPTNPQNGQTIRYNSTTAQFEFGV